MNGASLPPVAFPASVAFPDPAGIDIQPWKYNLPLDVAAEMIVTLINAEGGVGAWRETVQRHPWASVLGGILGFMLQDEQPRPRGCYIRSRPPGTFVSCPACGNRECLSRFPSFRALTGIVLFGCRCGALFEEAEARRVFPVTPISQET